jgi:hypothetical protein
VKIVGASAGARRAGWRLGTMPDKGIPPVRGRERESMVTVQDF